MTRTIPVDLGDRSYDVVIGEDLIDAAGERLRDLAGGRVFIVGDGDVLDLHGERLVRGLASGGLCARILAVAPGEASKSFAGLERLCEDLLALRIERGDLIVAFGGGVVGDLAGFAAAILKRGVDHVQIPTTLLAQVDSSVGGKTAIDTAHGKNLVGAFHQPRRVLADLGVLATLPAREMACGLAEILKIALAADARLFAWLEDHASEVLDRAGEPLARAVASAVALKAAIVADDERERAGGRRALLNLGHTFGHALEAETGFGDGLKHGEAVAIGCVLAFRLSAALSLCAPEEADRVQRAFAAAGLPHRLPPGLAADALLIHMAHDKKTSGGALTFILARAIGEAFVATGVDPAAVRALLVAEGAAP